MLPSEPPPKSRAELRRPRVLLVDDDPVVLRGLWRMLKSSRPDFKINGASGAAQALEALSELSYDAVITDLQMPGGSGEVLMRALAQHYPHTARIVHSSQIESLDTSQIRSLAHAVIGKPASELELVGAVEAAMRQTLGCPHRSASANGRLASAGTLRSSGPQASSLAIVANCMLLVPS